MARKKTRDYEKDLLERLKDPEYASEYLNSVIEDEEDENLEERFLIALSDVAKAHGISKLAKETHLWRKSLYKVLSPEGNPRFSTLAAILHAIGLRLQVATAERKL
ncbi:MAG: putative addiction module antidote protein [Deltaproteobacteria bacterium]|nr:putative addiction module antidote protein [Deltaproteobacteria bacterium]